MRATYLGVGLMVFAFSVAQAQTRPVPGPKPNDRLIAADAVKAVPVAEWEVPAGNASQVQRAEGKDAVAKAPANAVRYDLRTYTFATGTIRIFKFKKATGGVLHKVGDEKEIYVISGSVEVDINGTPTNLTQGDAANLPSGVLRGAQDATVIAFTVGSLVKDPKPSVVRLKDATQLQTAQWIKDGQAHSVKTPEEVAHAPPEAGKNFATRYDFNGNSIRVVDLKKGGFFDVIPSVPDIDNVMYIASGHMRFTQGKDVVDVYEGDAIREVIGVPHSWEMPEEGIFISTTAPAAGTPRK